MERQDIINLALSYYESSAGNRVSAQKAISASLVGMKMFDPPIFAFGAADDPLFNEMKNPSIVGEHHYLPSEWLPEAKTVISFFLPFTSQVRIANRTDKLYPSPEWLHARIEGQAFIMQICKCLQGQLLTAGYKTIVPALDSRFWLCAARKPDSKHEYTSNWSERHAGFICGLGTFGLSRGLITTKGMAGRLGSLITELCLPPDTRNYTRVNEYCSMCGACVQRCPVQAISIEQGKNHVPCSEFLDITSEKFKPRYGCGKCQVGVPCESRIPTIAL